MKFAPPALVTELFAEIEGKVKLIDELTPDQEAKTEGITADKAAVGELLVESCVLVAGIARAWARREQNWILHAKAKVTPTGLRRIPDGKLPEEARSIAAAIVEHKEALAHAGLKDSHLTELENRATAYEAVVTAPRNAIVARTTLTNLLGDEVRAAAQLLSEELDHLMHQFKADHPKFYRTYFNARRIVSMPTNPKKKKENGDGESVETAAEEGVGMVSVEAAPATKSHCVVPPPSCRGRF